MMKNKHKNCIKKILKIFKDNNLHIYFNVKKPISIYIGHPEDEYNYCIIEHIPNLYDLNPDEMDETIYEFSDLEYKDLGKRIMNNILSILTKYDCNISVGFCGKYIYFEFQDDWSRYPTDSSYELNYKIINKLLE